MLKEKKRRYGIYYDMNQERLIDFLHTPSSKRNAFIMPTQYRCLKTVKGFQLMLLSKHMFYYVLKHYITAYIPYI